MTTYRYNVSLRIWHPSLDPAEFTATLDLEPLHFDVAGQQRVRKNKTLEFVAKESYWTHQFELPDEPQDIEELLQNLASKLSQHKHFFANICATGGRSEFFIGFYPENFNCGFELYPSLQRDCADLNLTLSFDIYGYNPEQSVEA